MAELTNVALTIENTSNSQKTVTVTYDAKFSQEDIIEKKRYEVSIALYGTDLRDFEEQLAKQRGEALEYELFLSLGPPALYEFTFFSRLIDPFYFPRRSSNSKTIQATDVQVSYSDSALVEASVLDEDPGKIRIEFPPPCPSCPPLVINVERRDEVYAIVKLTPSAEIVSSSKSNVVNVPLNDQYGQSPRL